MKKMLCLCSVALACLAVNAELMPTIWADVPDVAPLRVGDTYYMTSTTMHFCPGIPVMASKDLIHWKTISYCYDTIESGPRFSLDNGQNDYGHGTWASSIRYNEADGYFYVSSFNAGARHTYLFKAKSPEGPWQAQVFRDNLVYDHSLWIENGKFYFFGSEKTKVSLREIERVKVTDKDGGEQWQFTISPKSKVVCPVICNNIPKGLGEGSQVFKRGEYYYLVNICWPRGHCRLVNVHRSKSLEGPFEEAHVAFEHEGIAQGSFIDRPDGSWVAVLFADRGAVGRIPFVLPVEWKDDWPTVKCEDAFSKVDEIPEICKGDEFEGEKLDLEWQWNHNPDNAHWKLDGGQLKITTSRVDDSLLTVKNTLTKRTFGPTCEAMVKLDGSQLKVGDKAGLGMLQFYWGAISLKRLENEYQIVLDQPTLNIKDRHLTYMDGAHQRAGSRTVERLSVGIGDRSTVYLKVVCDFTPLGERNFTAIPLAEDSCRYYYSLDGAHWTALGEAQYLPYTIPHFVGYRFALFNWATKEPGGTAAFDWYRVGRPVQRECLKMDGTNPIVKTRHTADPAAVVDGDWLYLFLGHDEPTARGYQMNDWSVVRTKDMKNWEDIGAVLSVRETFPWARSCRAWASQAIKRNGKWYWYCAVFSRKDRGESCVAVATADRPEGPWKDAIGGPLVLGRGYIDPSVFVDDDGKAWLFWGNCGGDPGCWYAKLKDNMIEIDPDGVKGIVPEPYIRQVMSEGVAAVPGLMDAKCFGEPLVKRCGAGYRRDGSKNTNFEEAPWIYKLGDTYYLEYAAGGVPEHWAYSTAKSVHGPWTYRGKIMDNAGGTGTIHGGSVFFKGQWYLVYHDGNLPSGGDCRRSVCIERYARNADGSIPFIKPTRTGVSE